jgi:hypothetical protein
MALSQANQITILWDQLLESFDSNNIMSRKVNVFEPDSGTMQNSNDVFHRPMPQIGKIVDGLNIPDAEFNDVIEMVVPSPLNNIRNDAFSLNALELRDERHMQRRAMGSAQKIAARINTDIANLVANTGTLVVAQSNAISRYNDVAECEALMDEQEVPIEHGRSFFFNTQDYKNTAADLANRQTVIGRPDGAYGKSMIGDDIAGFEAYRTNFLPTLSGSALTGVTVTSAQSFAPVPKDANGLPVDNRFADIPVSASAGFNVGDAITFANVNAVSHINKNNTGSLKTFRVVEVNPGSTANTIRVYPKPIALDDAALNNDQKTYANVNTTIANGAAVTRLNTSNATTNVFWEDNSVELISGHLAVDNDMFGDSMTILRETTDSGIELVMAYQGGVNGLDLKVRVTAFYGVVNLNPQMNGIMIGGQS